MRWNAFSVAQKSTELNAVAAAAAVAAAVGEISMLGLATADVSARMRVCVAKADEDDDEEDAVDEDCSDSTRRKAVMRFARCVSASSTSSANCATPINGSKRVDIENRR